LFADAQHWKAYWCAHIAKYIKGNVLEVGAGIGSNTKLLCRQAVTHWVSLEPDYLLARRMRAEMLSYHHHSGQQLKVISGTMESIRPHKSFDCILYLDVLEHIQDDIGELRKAAQHLNPMGTLVLLVPAYQFLYSNFDEAIGHHRRYTKGLLRKVVPPMLSCDKLLYLDSLGVLTSLSNRLFLKSRITTSTQIRCWDNLLVPVSRHIDRIFGYTLGRSLLGVWQYR
jgi:hypothetical protein